VRASARNIEEGTMSATAQGFRAASLRRMAILGAAALVVFLAIGALALWASFGTAVFFDVLAAGLAYCF
jgi:hypothetical protein